MRAPASRADCYLNGDRWCTLGPRPTRADKVAFVLGLLVLAFLGAPAWAAMPAWVYGGCARHSECPVISAKVLYSREERRQLMRERR